MNKPYISVVITAHNRTEFLMDAINSVLGQTLNRTLYEIIVVKNFYDPGIDDFLNRKGIINLKSRESSLLGEDIALGVENAKGEVLSFLDDDDQFYPQKLEHVYKMFRENKRIVYYHNNYSAINEKKQPIKFNNGSIDFNMSCITVRKKIIHKDKISKIEYLPDTFMYYSAVDYGGKVISDKLKLTRYTLHNSASFILDEKFDNSIDKKINLQRKHIETLSNYLVLFKSEKVKRKINAYITGLNIYSFIFRNLEKPKKIYNFLVHGDNPKSYRIILLGAYILVLISPNYLRKYVFKKYEQIYTKELAQLM